MRDGLTKCRHLHGVVERLNRRDDRLDRQRHVGPGIAIRDGIDVQSVHHILVASQDVSIGAQDLADVHGRQRRRRAHGQRC